MARCAKASIAIDTGARVSNLISEKSYCKTASADRQQLQGRRRASAGLEVGPSSRPAQIASAVSWSLPSKVVDDILGTSPASDQQLWAKPAASDLAPAYLNRPGPLCPRRAARPRPGHLIERGIICEARPDLLPSPGNFVRGIARASPAPGPWPRALQKGSREEALDWCAELRKPKPPCWL